MPIRIKKLDIPVVWVDTSVLIKWAKIDSGRDSSIDDLDKQRLTSLRTALKAGVEGGKLLVVAGDQEDEYATLLDTTTNPSQELRVDPVEVSAAHLRLSRGHTLQSIEEVLERRAAEAHATGIDLALDATVFIEFPQRPFESDGAFVVPFPGGPIPDRIQQSRYRRARELRELQKTSKFDRPWSILAEERVDIAVNSFWAEFVDLWSRVTTLEGWDLLSLGHAYARIKNIEAGLKAGGLEHPTAEDLSAFFRSKLFRSLPHVEIPAQLEADMLAGGAIGPTDVGDIDLLTRAIPACSHLIVDHRQKNRIERLGMPSRWGVTGYSTKTLDPLLAELGP